MKNRYKKGISIIILSFFLTMLVLPIATYATDSNTHYVHDTQSNQHEDIHTIHVPIQKQERTEKLDLVIVQDLSRSFQLQFPEVSNKLQEALDLLSPVLDRVSIVGYTSIKSSEASDSVLFNDPRAIHKVGNEGRSDEYYNILLKSPLQSDANVAKQVFKDIEANNLYGNGTPTAFGVNEALKYYMEQKNDSPSKKTLFLVVTDGFPNGDIDGQALVLSKSMHELLGPDTGILKAFSNIQQHGFHSSFALWQDSVALKKDLSETVYDNFNNYLEEHMPQATTEKEFYFNMTNQKNTIADFANTTKGIVQTHLNEELLLTERISDTAVYVEGSAEVLDTSGNPVPIPAPYEQPIVKNNEFSWQLDSLPPGEYTVSFLLSTPKTEIIEARIEASDFTMFVNDSFHPIDTISPNAIDSIGNNLTPQLRVAKNTVDVTKPDVYYVTYTIDAPEDDEHNHPLIDFGEIIFYDQSTQALHPLDYHNSMNAIPTEKTVTVTVLDNPIQNTPENDVPEIAEPQKPSIPNKQTPEIIASDTLQIDPIVATSKAGDKKITRINKESHSGILPSLGDNANWFVGFLGMALLTILWFRIKK
ncbi:hypothetical protein [Listeria rocourtiae]|uniref:hypothetical protein n=1 Tax=Listeria rocourtiae TaxID=647910 RepID=UPI003D2F6EAD